MIRFDKTKWDSFVENCGFSDDELEVVAYLRRELYDDFIVNELSISKSTLTRRKKRIKNKISAYILISN